MSYATIKTAASKSETTILPMLTSMRPAGSKAEKTFIKEWITPLGVEADRAGNLIKRIGDAPVLWSCHTDTVHFRGGRQAIAYGDGVVTLHDTKTGPNCLGADDTAGVWLMREMILAQRPGLYVFHRGEERGGIGSSYIADTTPGLLDGIQCAIALDRASTTDVITYQAGGRCCSNAFATSLAAQLLPGFKPCDRGVFTDTANYTTLVSECTNLSVGYYNQHMASERLDLHFLYDLRDALLALDTRDLTIARDPSAYEVTWSKYDSWDAMDEDNETLVSLIRKYPDETARVMLDFGLRAEDILAQVRFDRY